MEEENSWRRQNYSKHTGGGMDEREVVGTGTVRKEDDNNRVKEERHWTRRRRKRGDEDRHSTQEKQVYLHRHTRLSCKRRHTVVTAPGNFTHPRTGCPPFPLPVDPKLPSLTPQHRDHAMARSSIICIELV